MDLPLPHVQFPWIPSATTPMKASESAMVFMGAPELSTDDDELFKQFKEAGQKKAVETIQTNDAPTVPQNLDKTIETAPQTAIEPNLVTATPQTLTESNPSNRQSVDPLQNLSNMPDTPANPLQTIQTSRNWRTAVDKSPLPQEEIHSIVEQVKRIQVRKTEIRNSFEVEMVYATQLAADLFILMRQSDQFDYLWEFPIFIPPYSSRQEIIAEADRNREMRTQLKWEWKVLFEEEEKLFQTLLGK